MIREKWGQTNAFVSTDCGAVSNLLGQLEPSPGHTRLAASPEEAAAWTIMNGTDLEMVSSCIACDCLLLLLLPGYCCCLVTATVLLRKLAD
jgi:hypothetical protein